MAARTTEEIAAIDFKIGGHKLVMTPTSCHCQCGVDLAWALKLDVGVLIMLGCVACKDPIRTIATLEEGKNRLLKEAGREDLLPPDPV